jgi:hypothetical protein
MAVDPRNIDADVLASAIARRLASGGFVASAPAIGARYASPRWASPIEVGSEVLASVIAWRLAELPRAWVSNASAAATTASPVASSVAASELDADALAREVAKRLSDERSDRDEANDLFDALVSRIAWLLSGPRVHGAPAELDAFTDKVAYRLAEELFGGGGGLPPVSTDASEVVEETEKATSGEEDEGR